MPALPQPDNPRVSPVEPRELRAQKETPRGGMRGVPDLALTHEPTLASSSFVMTF
jgi:hypothetical protein